MSQEEALREHFFSINGLRICVLENGPAQGRPMVLLHGIGDNAHTWDLLKPCLAQHFRVIALDQRGHGRSSWAVPPAYRCEDYLMDLRTLIDCLRLDDFFLLGHSMGALHASLYTALNPGRVSALIHVDIEPRPPEWNHRYLSGLYENLPDSYTTPEEYISEIAKNAPYARKKDLQDLAAKSLIGIDGRWFRTYDRETLSCFDHYDLMEHLPAIRCPALVVRGAESRVLGQEAARQMVHILPAGELAEIPRATHPAHLDNPESFRETVMGFLKRHGFI